MVNFKKVLAVVLSTTMVIGGSFTVFAEDPAPTSGSADGAGASEGHVDKAIVDVVLPTTTATTFGYTMDPERLITATDAAKYAEGTVFPTTGDTGVYFLTETNKYANTSNMVQVVNKGAVDQMLTVEAQLTASEGGKDIAIVNEAPTDEATTAGLYLAAKVAKVTQALSTNKATWIINLKGNDANYEVAVKDNAYVYQKKTSGLTAWKAADIEVTGAVTDGIAVASDTTAPKITLTWKFEAIPQTAPSWTANTELSDYSDAPASAAPSIATTSYVAAADTPVEITVDLGTGAEAAEGIASITYLNKSGATKTVEENSGYTFSNNKITFTADTVNAFVTSSNDTRVYTITFDDEADTAVEVTFTKE